MSRITFKIDKGTLGADPEVKSLKDGTLMLKVSIAVNRYRKDEDDEWEQVGETSWVRAAAFGYTAECIELMELEKGQNVFAEGSMEIATWEDEDGDEVEGWNFRLDRLFPIPKVEFDEDDDRPKKKKKKGAKSKMKKRGKKSSKKGGKLKTKSKKGSKSGGSYADKILSQLKG